jgi:hypothetical protein
VKPTTRDILEPIGWQRVVDNYPVTAMRLVKALNQKKGGPQATVDLEQIHAVEQAIGNLGKAMAKLSSRLIDDIDREAAGEHWPDGDHTYVWDAYASCQNLLLALQNNRELAEKIIRNSSEGSISPLTGKIRKRRTPVSDDTLYGIASALAEVYMLGLRFYPKTAGTDSGTGEVNSLFNRTLSTLIEHKGYKVPSPKTIVNMANAAKRELPLAKLKLVLRENEATLHRWRITSFYAIATKAVIWRDMRDDEDSLWQQVTKDY